MKLWRYCPNCGAVLSYNFETKLWYCWRCRRQYEEADLAPKPEVTP